MRHASPGRCGGERRETEILREVNRAGACRCSKNDRKLVIFVKPDDFARNSSVSDTQLMETITAL